MKSYIIVCVALLVIAVALTIVAYYKTPIIGNPWLGVVWFIIAITLAELMAVICRYSDQEKGYAVSPGSPIFWAAICVLGTFPAIVCVVITSFIVILGRYVSSAIIKCIEKNSDTKSFYHNLLETLPHWLTALVQHLISFIRNLAALLPERSVFSLVLMHIQFVCGLVLFVGSAGLAYYYTGGHNLLVVDSHFSTLHNFLFPFIALVAVSVAADFITTIPIMVAVNIPADGASFREIILSAKLIAVEIFVPLVKPQLFLSVVALSLAYLYAHLHLLGFLVAATPVVALRDFFNQWVAEREAYVGTVTTLATYMQHYHPYTRGHLKRVADLSERLARELSLPIESIRFIGTAGMLHDIGKIGVSEEILDKTEKLTDDEWQQIKEHPVKGAEIISHLEFLDSIVDWIKYHHKWYNGSGYPATNGNGSSIPLEAMIIATVDAFDAMTDDRELTLDWKCDSCGYTPADGQRPDTCPVCGAQKRRTYREPKTLDAAIDELRRGAGSQFHPMVVKAFLTMIDRDGVKTNA
ncbi:MAG: HD domain-containing phosphohydrolase [Armatimonadota bacterium]